MLVGTLEAALVLALVTGAALVVAPWRATAGQRADEKLAIETVRRIAATEEAYRRRPGAPASAEYGTLEDLAKGGWIDDPIAHDESIPHLDVGGYRIEILRPERLERDGRVRWIRGNRRVDPALASTTFAVTAIPRRGAERGLRAFYVDARGRFYAAEGVQDADRDPSRPPPSREFRDDREELDAGPVWRLADPSPRK